MLVGKITFEKKYPLLAPIFEDETVRKNLLDNTDFAQKYTTNNALISIFIFELQKRFDIDTTRRIVTDTVVKYPDTLLVSFITSYLNSDEATKNNSDVVSYYNKTSNLGVGVMYYMEENGIVSNRTYKELPYLLIDDKYKRLRKDEYVYANGKSLETLDEVYETLSYPEREVIVEILENGNFHLIAQIFERFNYDLKTIIGILYANGIDSRIINDKVAEALTPYIIMIMICLLLDVKTPEVPLVNIYKMIELNRLELLHEIVVLCLIEKIGELEWKEIEHLSDGEIINKLKTAPVTLTIKDN